MQSKKRHDELRALLRQIVNDDSGRPMGHIIYAALKAKQGDDGAGESIDTAHDLARLTMQLAAEFIEQAGAFIAEG